jgi:hypothetical protein
MHLQQTSVLPKSLVPLLREGAALGLHPHSYVVEVLDPGLDVGVGRLPSRLDVHRRLLSVTLHRRRLDVALFLLQILPLPV